MRSWVSSARRPHSVTIAERAVRAAFAVRDWAEEDGLEVRIAVNTGEAIVELAARARARRGHGCRRRRQYRGPPAIGRTGRSGARRRGDVRGDAQRRSSTGPRSPSSRKGRVRRSVWVALRATRQIGERPTAPVPMIGRERELSVLTGIWERVLEEGRAQFVTVFGPSGIGKSRIALELSETRRRPGRPRHPRAAPRRTAQARRTAHSHSR